MQGLGLRYLSNWRSGLVDRSSSLHLFSRMGFSEERDPMDRRGTSL